jgi:hypothetical protein
MADAWLIDSRDRTNGKKRNLPDIGIAGVVLLPVLLDQICESPHHFFWEFDAIENITKRLFSVFEATHVSMI